jgi:hypothetical protein
MFKTDRHPTTHSSHILTPPLGISPSPTKKIFDVGEDESFLFTPLKQFFESPEK